MVLYRPIILWLAAFPCHASISGIAAGDAGNVYFSDWLKNKIWRIDVNGTVALVSEKHTHHLLVDRAGNLYGEHANSDGSVVSLWRRPVQGVAQDVIPPARRADRPTFQGGPFLIDIDDSVVTLKGCQIWRISGSKSTRLAGEDCGEREWSDAELRFSHIHGTLAWGPDHTIYFTDAKTVRRITPDGSAFTVQSTRIKLFSNPLPEEFKFNRALGLAVTSAGVVYVADSGRGVARIQPDGSLEWIYRSSPAWSPYGLAAAGGFVYVVEDRPDYLQPLNSMIGNPRVRRIAPDGTAVTLSTIRNEPLRIVTGIGVVVGLILMAWLTRGSRRAHLR